MFEDPVIEVGVFKLQSSLFISLISRYNQIFLSFHQYDSSISDKLDDSVNTVDNFYPESFSPHSSDPSAFDRVLKEPATEVGTFFKNKTFGYVILPQIAFQISVTIRAFSECPW